MFKFLILLFSFVPVCTFAANPTTLKDLQDKTIIPIEIRTPMITCDRTALVNSATGNGKEFFLGQYRVFSNYYVNSRDLEYGLNFITHVDTSCFVDGANAFSIVGVNMEKNSMEIRYLHVTQENIGRVTDRLKGMIDGGGPYAGIAAIYAQNCPWGELKGDRFATGEAKLNCQIVNKPAAQTAESTIDTVKSSIMSYFAWGEKKPTAGDKTENIKTTKDVAVYLWQADFELKDGKGAGDSGATVGIQSYVVCKDKAERNIMAFAVMKKPLGGLKHMCK